MNYIDKPKYCGQKWNEMLPTNGGRICGKCEKTIVDFSESKWVDIKQKLNENSNSLCGMYSEKQLKYWGQEPPTMDLNYKKPIYISSFILSLFSISPKVASSQTLPSTKIVVPREETQSAFYVDNRQTIEKIVIKGKMYDQVNNESIAFAYIGIRGTKKIATTDTSGNFEIDITDIADTTKYYSVFATYVGYMAKEIIVKNKITKSTTIDFAMVNGPSITYGIEVVKKKRFYKIRKWFNGK